MRIRGTPSLASNQPPRRVCTTSRLRPDFSRRLARFAKPLLKKKTRGALILALIGRILSWPFRKLFAGIVWLIGKIVLGHCKRVKKEFKKTHWYEITEGRRLRRDERLARKKIYGPLKEIFGDEALWKRLYGSLLDKYGIVKERKQR